MDDVASSAETMTIRRREASASLRHLAAAAAGGQTVPIRRREASASLRHAYPVDGRAGEGIVYQTPRGVCFFEARIRSFNWRIRSFYQTPRGVCFFEAFRFFRQFKRYGYAIRRREASASLRRFFAVGIPTRFHLSDAERRLLL